jgi:hypothetical protein
MQHKRFLRISDDCNRQFRVLFNLAKQVEVNRVNLTLRTAEKFLSQFAEALSFAGIQNKGASGKFFLAITHCFSVYSRQIKFLLILKLWGMGKRLSQRSLIEE